MAQKTEKQMIAEWRYEDVPEKLWTISDITDFWGNRQTNSKTTENKWVYIRFMI